MRRRGIILAVCAVASIASACGGSDTRVTRVGVLYPLTGAQGMQGTEEQRGVKLAAEWANDHGGIDGNKIELVTVDTPRAEAVPDTMRDLASKGITVVVGSHGSAISAEAAETATKENMIFWETGAVGQIAPDVSGGSRFFRLAPMGANLGSAAIDFLTNTLQSKLGVDHPLRIAVTNVDDAYGRAVADGATEQIAKNGAVDAGRFQYPLTGADYGTLADQIGAAHADALFVAAYLDDGVALREAIVQRHIHFAASIGTSSSYCHPAFGERLGADAVGLFASDKPDANDVRADALTPEGRRTLLWARKQYESRYHTEMSAPALSGFSNAYALFVHVLPSAGSLKPSAVARAALATKLPIGTLANGGGLDLVPPGQPDAGANDNAASVIWEWVAPKTRAVVWPAAFATHPIVVLPLAA